MLFSSVDGLNCRHPHYTAATTLDGLIVCV
jgi:hypothetical protein